MGYLVLFCIIAAVLGNKRRASVRDGTALLKWENSLIYVLLIIGGFVLWMLWTIFQTA